MNFGKALIHWYRLNKRPLPWRRSKDPYGILISEIMLQQTTSSAVIPYYKRFLKIFPSIQALALAPEEKVLSLWSGLGYYSRARNLHQTAKAIVDQGFFPNTYSELLKLKGIGPYTAAAVASIGFDQQVAAVDGNVSRVVSRVFDMFMDITSTKGKQEIKRCATELIKGQPPSEHNQAMMELGATICIPKNPPCLLCPVSNYCLSFKNGNVDLRPVKTKKRKQESWLWTLYYLKKGKQIGLVKSLNGTPWLKNTWVLPGTAKPWTEKKPPESDFRHSITHHKIFVKIKNAKPEDLKLKEIRWVNPQDTGKLGVSSVVQKALKQLGFTMLMLVFLGGCKSEVLNRSAGEIASAAETSVKPLIVPKDFSPPKLKQLTFEGENGAPVFSPDGSKLMFQSKNRPFHKNSQIYLLDLKSNRERRLTYNDGEDTAPSYSPSGKTILYSSTTDELKEHPEATDSKAPYLNYEIYFADSDGSHRLRLTRSPGYDAEGVFAPDGKKILFCSRRDGYNELFIMDFNGHFPRHFISEGADTKDVPFREGARFSPNGKNIVWSESSSKESTSSEIFVSDELAHNKRKLTTKGALHLNPSWSPDGKRILFASNRDDADNFEIYLLSIDTGCLKRLTFSPEKDLFPIFSPDGKFIVSTNNRSGISQVYEMDFQEPPNCLSEKP